MNSRNPSRRLLVRLATTAALVVFALPAQSAAAQPLDDAPVVGLGYSSARGTELGTLMLGWRWRYDAGRTLNDWLRNTSWRPLLVVEPSVSLVGGDQDTFEVTVLPMLRLQQKASEGPAFYFEGGIGIVYSEIRGVNLGSTINFNDSFGLGLSFPSATGGAWDIGYRIRHISHAKLWAESNKGWNTHFLTFTYQPPGS